MTSSTVREVRREAAGPSSGRAVDRAWNLVRELLTDVEMADRMSSLTARFGLAPGPIKTLLRLQRGGYPSMRDIARGLGCDPSYVTGLVDDLAAHGLVERQSHPGDRRVKTVVLTPAGIEMAEEVERVFSAPPAAFEALSPAEARQLAELLEKVTRAAGSPPS